MADLVHEGEVLAQDFTEIEASDFGLADVSFVDQHFIDPKGRTVRVRSFYRLDFGRAAGEGVAVGLTPRNEAVALRLST